MIIKNATLQTLFPYWKIAIFRRIAPRKIPHFALFSFTYALKIGQCSLLQ